MPLFPELDEDAMYFSMFDENQHWCRTSIKPFVLDELECQTVEHYFQAMRFADLEYRNRVASAESIEQVEKLAKRWFKTKRKDWNKVRTTVMTRALYLQCQMYPEMAEALRDTGDQKLVESSMYDYFWGCGRDRRGENQYGTILMNIRKKLLES